MIITISGPLGWDRHYAGGMKRAAAKKRGMTIDEYNKLGESDPSTDKEVDDELVRIGKEEDNVVVEGRTAFHFIPHSLKVYIDVSLEEAARRISSDKSDRNEKAATTHEQMVQNVKERMASDAKRYQQYYGIDYQDKANYDFVIDSTHISAQEVAQKIMARVQESI
jgi:cytidylate kinase